MFRFILFLGFLVGLGYVLTEPPASKMALSANEIPVRNDKPLLTSWGPTLGSLRNGVGKRIYAGEPTTLVASNDAPYGDDTGASTAIGQDPAAPDTGTVVASAETTQPAAERTKTDTPERATTLAEHKQPVAAEPAVDRIAAALPPQRRGLFSRALAPQGAQEPRATHQVEAAPHNRGLFKRLLGRGKQPTRAWALGPAR